MKPVIDLDYPRKDGTTLRQHYEQLQRWDWIEDKTPEILPEGSYLWEWFWDIVGGKGAEEGFWNCLRSWSEMTKLRPTMWEVETLRGIYGEYQKAVSIKMREK